MSLPICPQLLPDHRGAGKFGHVQQPCSYPFNDATSWTLSPRYDEVRANPGLTRVQLPFGEPAWLVVDYHQVRFVLSDPRFSRVAAAGRDVPRQSESRTETGLLALDPPDHARLRSFIAKAFTLRLVERLRPDIHGLCGRLVRRMRERGAPADFVAEYALPVSFGAIAALLAIPEEDRTCVRTWSEAHLSTNALTPVESAARTRELHAYMWAHIRRKRGHPGEDLISALIEARSPDGRLTDDELVQVALDLLLAGFEATATQIPNFVLFLLERPSRWAEAERHPDNIPTLVEELLRFVPLTAGAGTTPRYAVEDVRVGGTLVRAGQAVITSLGASNRDGRAFAWPEIFDPNRFPNRHLAFGDGPHHCVGMSLARIELQEALAAVLRELPGLRLAGEFDWKQQVMRGPITMPVAWESCRPPPASSA
jgi:cytochrome P450